MWICAVQAINGLQITKYAPHYLDFLKVLSNNSSLACWFPRWKGLFSLAARQILPVDFSIRDVNTY